jgi:hypothetical protein
MNPQTLRWYSRMLPADSTVTKTLTAEVEDDG